MVSYNSEINLSKELNMNLSKAQNIIINIKINCILYQNVTKI